MSLQHRDSLNGSWMLDKTRGNWEMKEYLETMQVDHLAIEAHEKGDKETDTIHTLELDTENVKIIKRSRVNNDLVVELELGTEQVEYLHPGERPKRLLAKSNHKGHLQINSVLQTLNNGRAVVTDIKELAQETSQTVMVQTLTIVNEQTQKSHSVCRYFLPCEQPPPFLVPESNPKPSPN
jgi:hypothetical protein